MDPNPPPFNPNPGPGGYPEDPLSDAEVRKIAECQRTNGTAPGCGIGSRNDPTGRRDRQSWGQGSGHGARKGRPPAKTESSGLLGKVWSGVKTAASLARKVYRAGKVACALGARAACDFIAPIENAVEDLSEWVGGLFGVGASGRKDDIRQIDSIVDALGLNKRQRRMLHDEITGQDLSLDEIRAIAEEYARSTPKKGRGGE